MRTVDATLTAALLAGSPTPYLKAYLGYETGATKATYTGPNILAYRLTGTSLEFWIKDRTKFNSDQETIWLERGLTIGGTTYTVTTGMFFIWEAEYFPNQTSRYKGYLVPPRYYSAAGDVTYETAIDAFFTAWGKTTTYKDDTEAWLDYQFLPAGQNVIMNNALRFLNLLHQKRLITVCDNGSEDVRIYSADILGSSVLTVDVEDEFSLQTTEARSRQYIWRDENSTMYQDGTLTDPIHNLGYLESTDNPPARHSTTIALSAYVRPDLRIQDGDILTCRFYNAAVQIPIFAQVTEEWDSRSTQLPRWRLKLEANPVFHSTEGGALPSTIERVSNYTPLNTSNFDGILSDHDNNLQAAIETIDDHGPHTSANLISAYGLLQSISAGATRYLFPGCDGLQTTEPAVHYPVAGSLSNLSFKTWGAQPASGSMVVTLLKNSSPTTLTVTVAAGAAAGIFTDDSNSVTFSAGDYFSWKIVNNASGASATIGAISMLATV